ncbi:hypothetical protein ACP4OV_026480 [Aristida adscensionis]
MRGGGAEPSREGTTAQLRRHEMGFFVCIASVRGNLEPSYVNSVDVTASSMPTIMDPGLWAASEVGKPLGVLFKYTSLLNFALRVEPVCHGVQSIPPCRGVSMMATPSTAGVQPTGGEVPGHSPDDADLISGLGDDVLGRILELLPDTRDAVRTAALSRRWRGLWTRVPHLRFSSDSWPEFTAAGDAERFVAFVDGALALRAAQTQYPAAQRLAISLKMDGLPRREARAAALRECRAELRLPMCYRFGSQPPAHQLSLDGLAAGSTNLETMHLALGEAVTQLPAAAAAPAMFSSLTDLSLEDMRLVEGTGHLLARLLSPACCPRLQKLRLRNLLFADEENSGLEELLIEFGELKELSMGDMEYPETLELRTPNLRVLRIAETTAILTLAISAPRLENLVVLGQPDQIIYIESELPCVGSLVVELEPHGYYIAGYEEEEDDDDGGGGGGRGANDGSIRILQSCTKARCLDVCVRVTERKYRDADAIKGRIPHLPHITSLTVHVKAQELHSFGVGMVDILTQCSNMKYLRVHNSILMRQRIYIGGISCAIIWTTGNAMRSP